MARNLLNRLLGRPAALAPEMAAALTDLARLAQDRPTLQGPAAFLMEVLPRLFEEPVREQPPAIAAEHAARKREGGTPLLRGESRKIDTPSFRSRWQHVCEALRHQGNVMAPPLADAIRQGKLDAATLADWLLDARLSELYARADALGLDAGLTQVVLRLTLYPVLVHWRTALSASLPLAGWLRGCCPICGSQPLLGEFRGLEQIRFLRCGHCAAEWEFPRLACPFCPNRDHHGLGYVHVEGEEARCRIAVCESCRGYVKMISTLTSLTAPGLLAADVATLHLDLVAAGQGWAVPV